MHFWQRTRRFFDPCFAFPWVTFMRLFTTMNTTCFSLYLVYVLKKVVQNLEQGNIIWFHQNLVTAMIVMVSFMILWYIFRNYYWVEQQFKWHPYLVKKYFTKFVRLRQDTIEMLGTGRILSIIDKGIDETITSILWILSYTTRLLSTIFFWLILAQWIPWHITTSWIIVIFIIFSSIIYFNKYTSHYRKLRKENNVKITGLFAKIIMSKFEVLQNNGIEREVKKVTDISDVSRDLARKQNVWTSLLFQTPKFLLSSIIIGCYYYFGTKVLWGTYLLSDMIWLLAVLVLFETTLRDSIEYYENFTKSFIHIDKLWDFMDNSPEIKWYDTGRKFIFNNGNFRFQEVTFHYEKSRNVLKNFSLNITWGKKTALVGHSWSGKTTLMKLLAGYMRPTKWSILIDEQDITKIRLNSYYPHIGYLTQEPSVFDGTIEENLLYGIQADMRVGTKGVMKKIALAIELAECQFIYELEQGIHTEIGERWIRLSGGQKQRLAIAKIFLKNPEIILLDEPTAALDSYSEQKVAKAFEHLFKGRTVVVIAHRLQTVKSADDIIVLDKGKIVERGTHETLTQLWGKYAGMVDLQSGFVIEDEDDTMQKISSSSKKLNKGSEKFDQETPYYA